MIERKSGRTKELLKEKNRKSDCQIKDKESHVNIKTD